MECESGNSSPRVTGLANLKYHRLAKVIAFIEVMSKSVGLIVLTIGLVVFGVVLERNVNEKRSLDDGGLFVLLFYAGSCIIILSFVVLMLLGSVALHRATNINLVAKLLFFYSFTCKI